MFEKGWTVRGEAGDGAEQIEAWDVDNMWILGKTVVGVDSEPGRFFYASCDVCKSQGIC